MKNWDAIEKKIVAIEKEYDCELVTVITERSSSYMEIKFWYAFIFSVMTYVLAVNYLFPNLGAWFLHDYVYGAFIFSSILIFMGLMQIPFIGQKLISSKIRNEKVQRNAYEAFCRNSLHQTKKRRTLLIFISKLERKFFLLPDVGFSFEKNENQWQDLANKMKLSFHGQKFEIAYDQWIDELKVVLSQNKIISQELVAGFDNAPKKI
ncbi:MAG: hypothetical protein QE271_03920 [Bacteriovoracaceae bacterium]|nr:hypothetical protein [Bacteriovoracaceae bacterium]